MPEVTLLEAKFTKTVQREGLGPTWRVVAVIYIFPIWLKKRLLMNSWFSLGYPNRKSMKLCIVIGLKKEHTNTTCTPHYLNLWGFFCVQVFRVVSVCLGTPPDTICWEYRDKDKTFHRIGPLTPKEFYLQHVKPLYNLKDKV